MRGICITLDPKDPYRAQRAVKEIKALGFQPYTLLGVNGYLLSKKDLLDLLSPRSLFELENGRYVHEGLSSPGAVGCYLAHVKAWRYVLENNRICAIFEDDFVAKSNAKNILSRTFKELENIPFDICRLQHRSNPDLGEDLKVIPGTNLAIVKRTEGLASYILTPKGAKKLLETAFPIDSQVDHYIDFACQYHKLNHLALIEDIFYDPQLPSLIRHNSLQNPRCRNDCVLF